MKNKITDLNNHLFAQLERLGEEGMSAEQIEREVKRTDAIVAVSEQIVHAASLRLKASALIAEHGVPLGNADSLLEGKSTPAAISGNVQ